jgi:uncharacterized coiled-coil protein SlyX
MQGRYVSDSQRVTAHPIEARFKRLEHIIEQLGKTVLATTETVETMAKRVDMLAVQVQHQNHQVKQQGYQIFALSDALENLIVSQNQNREHVKELVGEMKNLVDVLKDK